MNALIKSVQNFTDSQQLDDDVCLVALRLHWNRCEDWAPLFSPN
jgi:hypothetical protein